MQVSNKFGRILTSVVLFLLTLVPLLHEPLSSSIDGFASDKPSRLSELLSHNFWYQWVVKAGSRTPRNHYARLVTLDESREPSEIFGNKCKQRVFFARLIDRLQTAQPAIIVLDKYFVPDLCKDAASNNRLIGAVSRSRIPVLTGYADANGQELERRTVMDDKQRSALQGALLLEPVVDLHTPGAQGAIYGSLRANNDPRKIPIQWRAYNRLEEVGATSPRIVQTLALAAALKYDPYLADQSRFKNLIASGRHPFTSFLSQAEIPALSALYVLCGDTQNRDWQNCPPKGGGDEVLRGHVIVVGVVGSRTGEDYHPSVVGTVPGMVLLANYIESLLDDRWFRPVPFSVSIGINLALIFTIGLLFLSARKAKLKLISTPLRALLLSIPLACSTTALSYFIALHLGYYLDFWGPSAVALFGIWAESVVEKSSSHGRTVIDEKPRITNHVVDPSARASDDARGPTST